ncbi:hypothetical protein D3C84_918920 [compost metagenome]
MLAELYSNALEHGVLGLDSALKCDAEGFSRYYQQRASRLASLAEGYVRFHLELQPQVDGGRLCVRVEDSGSGFDVTGTLACEHATGRLSGRGLRLVRQLARHCEWSADGRGVSVEFCWPAQA